MRESELYQKAVGIIKGDKQLAINLAKRLFSGEKLEDHQFFLSWCAYLWFVQIHGKSSDEEIAKLQFDNEILGKTFSHLIIVAPPGIMGAYKKFFRSFNVVFIEDDKQLSQTLHQEIKKISGDILVLFSNRKTQEKWSSILANKGGAHHVVTLSSPANLPAHVNFYRLKQQVSLLVGENVKYGSVSNTFKHN